MATPTAKVKNLMVGKWIPAQRDLLLKWVKKEMVKLRKNKEKQYKKLREYFPEGSEEEVIQEFQRNIGRIKEIQIIVGLNYCILPLLIAMGTEPNVGMLIVEMFRQQNIEGVSVIDMLFLLNEVVRFAPLYIDEDLGKHYHFIRFSEDNQQCFCVILDFFLLRFLLHYNEKKTAKNPKMVHLQKFISTEIRSYFQLW